MNEEKILQENDITETVEVLTETLTETNTSGNNKIFGKVVTAVTCVAVGVGILWYKTKDKREERLVNKLIKKGYKIEKPEEYTEQVIETDCTEVTEE